MYKGFERVRMGEESRRSEQRGMTKHSMRIFELLAGCGQMMTARDIGGCLGIDTHTVYRAVRPLYERGLVLKLGGGKRLMYYCRPLPFARRAYVDRALMEFERRYAPALRDSPLALASARQRRCWNPEDVANFTKTRHRRDLAGARSAA